MENMLELYHNKLSKREAQVANKVREGLSNRTIAEQLFISERTVKFHCTNIFRKLAINNRKMLRSLFPNAYETA
ncbi:response regulator transcription factor [Aliiglaciecola sp. SL4]|uniref:response regulator transcription factor n=1 Tax=Aliiglaciecola sp. SL4 TaxID=3239806 RepID=UPI00355B3D63